MKIIFLSFYLFFGCSVFCQSHQIMHHSGLVLDVDYIKKDKDFVYYSNPGSQEELVISTYAVAWIKNLNSMQKVEVSPNVVINAKKDFDKVVILDNQNVASGLKIKQRFKGQLNKAKGISVFEQLENTKRAIKYMAADQGFPFASIVKLRNGKYEAVTYSY